ncbi:rubredoxin-like [Juglans microcarpa x Juglans regia]|uniref:rubredoxin-like n=1 Tax=Juglans microcarpa x Juglans regia TaxID=2249226 RepID=UPI001B7EA1B0|nr:rubredoxin-like [Juglans microcarpa x Juglans regia]
MACATTRPTFSFHLSTSFPQSTPPKPKPHFPAISPVFPKLSLLHKPHILGNLHSIDISKEDTPTSSQQPSSNPEEPQETQENFDKRRLEEKFAVLNTGIYECRSCGHKYDEAVGDPSYPVPPGLQFDKLPVDWRCPTCGAAKSFFESKSVEIAGFAQNQQFGLGGNALTSGQKAILIYGSLLLFFVLFLSGYWLQ